MAAVGSRQSTGPLQIAELDINLINDVFLQIQNRIDILSGLTGQDLSVTVANSSTVAAGRIVKALTSTTLTPAIPGTLTVTGDYVAPGAAGAISGLTANKVPRATNAKVLQNGSITDSGTLVTIPVKIDLSGIAGGAAVLKITSTTDTPVTVFSGAGTIFLSLAPVAFLELEYDGANVGYIPVVS